MPTDDELAPLERENPACLTAGAKTALGTPEGVTTTDIVEHLPLPLRGQAARAVRPLLLRVSLKGSCRAGRACGAKAQENQQII